MKRTAIDLQQVASLPNLALAFHKAAKGKRARPSVQGFAADLENQLSALAADILKHRLPYGRYREFTIYDPKKRLIHAACFQDRVFHHALMNWLAPVLERAMVPTSYACRPGKGVHQAVSKVQQHLRSYAYYVKIDIDGYFAAIDHRQLLNTLARRFKGKDCHRQLQRIIASYNTSPGKGLPIGSLTSQYFANYFLDGLDRTLAANHWVRAKLRYMDDIIWWVDHLPQAWHTLQAVEQQLNQLGLKVKPNIQIQACSKGVTYCGFRILPGTIRLTRRRQRRFAQRRQYWEQLFKQGRITGQQLQQAYSAVESICSGCDCLAWRNRQLALHAAPEV